MARDPMGVDVLDVREMVVTDVPGLEEAWQSALRAARTVQMDIADGKQKIGARLSLTMSVDIVPLSDGLKVAAKYKVGLPAVDGESLHVHARRGKFLVQVAEQPELFPRRVVALSGDENL